MEVKYWLLRQLQLKDTHTQTELQSRFYATRQATVMHFKDGLVLLTSLYRITRVRAWGRGEVMFVASDTSPGTHSMPPVTTGTGKINYPVKFQILFGPQKITVVFKGLFNVLKNI